MSKWRVLSAAIASAAILTAAPGVRASARRPTLVVTMTNNPDANEIRVYDAQSHVLLQTLSTRGRGGAAGNARGVRQYGGEIVAAVNNGSGTVAVFRRDGDVLKFDKLVSTTSAPVSVDFGDDHMYVAGATTVDSFDLQQGAIDGLDGTADLSLAGGGTPPSGSTGQVGLVGNEELLVTLKTDPDPGTVDVVTLDHGRITGQVTPVAAPDGSLAPFGFASLSGGAAVITLAHSNQDGLFRDGAFTSVVAAGQAASCWMTRTGDYIFVANTGSRSISRLVGTGSHIFIDSAVAAPVATGAPADIDADSGILGVIDHGSGQSHLSLFTFNRFGELAPSGSVITIGVPDANGVAIVAPGLDGQN